MDPINVGVEVEELFGYIGHLFVETQKLRLLIHEERSKHANQSISSEQAGNGRLSASPENSTLLDGRMSKEVPRQTGQR